MSQPLKFLRRGSGYFGYRHVLVDIHQQLRVITAGFNCWKDRFQDALKESKVTEIASEVYLYIDVHPDYQIQFNQFLIKDEGPFMLHTGRSRRSDFTREAIVSIVSIISIASIASIASIIEPAQVR